MSRHSGHRGLFLLAATVAASLGGCIDLDLDIPIPLDVREQLLVLPDGSGKMTMTIVLLYEDPEASTKEKIAEDFGQPATPSITPDLPPISKNTAAELAPDSGAASLFRALFQGGVAYREEFQIPHDGAAIATCTVYFDDVNKFQYGDPGEPATFGYQKLPDGFALEIKNADALDVQEVFAEWGPKPDAVAYWEKLASGSGKRKDPDGAGRAAKAFAQSVLQGPRVSQDYTLPGEINEAGGSTTTEGRTARFRIEWQDLKGLDDAQVAAKVKEALADRRIVCDPSALSEKDIAAFRRELEEAKAACPQTREKAALEKP